MSTYFVLLKFLFFTFIILFSILFVKQFQKKKTIRQKTDIPTICLLADGLLFHINLITM